nr:hypothetical protein BaRGS_025673 [Batillaria attramentaria]
MCIPSPPQRPALPKPPNPKFLVLCKGTAITPGHLDGNEIGDDMLGLGPGLEPLQIAVGGITNPNPEDDITTEEA